MLLFTKGVSPGLEGERRVGKAVCGVKILIYFSMFLRIMFSNAGCSIFCQLLHMFFFFVFFVISHKIKEFLTAAEGLKLPRAISTSCRKQHGIHSLLDHLHSKFQCSTLFFQYSA